MLRGRRWSDCWLAKGCRCPSSVRPTLSRWASTEPVDGSPGGSHLPSYPLPCKLFYNDVYEVHLPQGHRFPMEKYRMVRERLQAELASSGLAEFEVSPLATLDEVLTTHEESYVRRYMAGEFTAQENRAVGFPWSEASVARSLSSVGGTIAAARAVSAPEGPLVAGHIAGGTHHAFAGHGEGFCVFSDIAVATNVILLEMGDQVRPCGRVVYRLGV
jgi:acetoin utilization deacetylase AcuC-like enzyme